MAPKNRGAKDDNAEPSRLGVASLLPPIIRNLIAPPPGAQQAKPSAKPLVLRAPSSLDLKAIKSAQRTPAKLDLYAQSRERQKLKPKAASSTVSGLLGKRREALAENDRRPGLLTRRGVSLSKATTTTTKATKRKASTATTTKRKATKRKATDADAPRFPIPTTAKPERSGGSDDQ